MKLVKYPDSILKSVCEEVKLFDEQLHKELDEMHKIMLANNGIGLAANQVGLSYRFFIMKTEMGGILDIINPVIISTEGISNLLESCLSAPGIVEFIANRPNEIHFTFQDRHGEKKEAIVHGLEAVCFAHELDHLNGIFFLEKLNRQRRREYNRQYKWDL